MQRMQSPAAKSDRQMAQLWASSSTAVASTVWHSSCSICAAVAPNSLGCSRRAVARPPSPALPANFVPISDRQLSSGLEHALNDSHMTALSKSQTMKFAQARPAVSWLACVQGCTADGGGGLGAVVETIATAFSSPFV